MPIVDLTSAMRAQKMRRMLIVGAPNTFKTTSLAMVPRPAFLFSYPGEEGAGALPTAPDIISRTYEIGPNDVASVIWGDVERVTWEAIAGKYGPIKSFCGDGLYQLSVLALDVVSGGLFSKGEKVDPFLYPQATNKVVGYLKRVLDSPVPYAFFTCWEGKEVIDPLANAKSDSPRALYPHLPGALAKQVMGLFSVVGYCEVEPTTVPGKPAQGWWRIKPTLTIRSAGVKMPMELALKLPERVPMNWASLEPLLCPKVNSGEGK